MPTEVQLPDGRVLTFPDGMPREEMAKQAMAIHQGRASASSETQAADGRPPLTSRERAYRALTPKPDWLPENYVSVSDLLEDESADPLLRMQAAREVYTEGGGTQGPSSRITQAAEYILPRTPFNPLAFADIFGQGPESMLRRARENFSAGNPSKMDLYLLVEQERRSQKHQELRQQGWAGVPERALDTASYLPGFATEFMVTGGAFRGLKAAPKGASLAARAIDAAALITFQSAMMPHRTGQEYQRRRADGKTHGRALFESLADTLIEVASEHSGKLMSKIAARAKAKFGIEEYFKRHGAPTGFSQLIRRSGYDGAINEMLEERVGEVARSLTIDDPHGATGDILEGKYNEAAQQVVSELMAFVVPGLGQMRTPEPGQQEQAPPQEQQQADALRPENDQRHAEPPAVETSPAEFEESVRQSVPEYLVQEVLEGLSAPVSIREGVVESEAIPDTSQASSRPLGRRVSQAVNAKAAREFFDRNPDVAEKVAALEDNPSRSQFADITGIPRTQLSRGMIQSYIDEARVRPAKVPAQDVSEESHPKMGGAEYVARNLQDFAEGARAKLSSAEGFESLLREGLQAMSASEIAEAYGYRKREKKKLIEMVVRDFAAPPKQSKSSVVKQEPISEPESPSPATRRIDDVLQSPPTRRLEDAPLSPAPPLAPAAQAVFDQLPESKDELYSLARTLGIEVPKKATKAYAELDTANLRRDIARTMADPSSRRGLVGEVKPPETKTSPAQESPSNQSKPSLADRVRARNEDSTAQESKLEPKDTSDVAVQQGLRIAERSTGRKPVVVEPSNETEREIAEFVKYMGFRPVFVRNARARGFAHHGVVFMKSGRDSVEGAWNTAGHELVHATGLDSLYEVFDRERIEALRDEYMEDIKKTLPNVHARLLKDEEAQMREGAARLVGKFFESARFRSELKSEKKSAWAWLVDKLHSLMSGFKSENDDIKKAINLLNQLRSRQEFKDSMLEAHASDTFNQLAESGLIAEEDREAFVREFQSAAAEIALEARSKMQSIESMKSKAKQRLGLTISQFRKMQNEGQDYSSLKNFDTLARDMAEAYPELVGTVWSAPPGEAKSRDSEGNYSQELWDQITQPRRAESPSVNDAEILDAAEERVVGDYLKRAEEWEEVDYRYGLDLLDSKDAGYLRSVIEIIKKHDPAFKDVDSSDRKLVVKAVREVAKSREVDDSFEEGEVPFEPESQEESREEINRRIAEEIKSLPNSAEAVRRVLSFERNGVSLDDIHSQRPFGWANPGTTAAGRSQIMLRDIILNRPDVRSRQEAIREAMAALEDAEGQRAKFIDRFRQEIAEKSFTPLTETETVIVRSLLDDVSVSAAVIQSQESLDDLRILHEGYRRSRSETARALSLRDPVGRSKSKKASMALLDMLFGHSKERVQELIELLKSHGIDLSDPATLQDVRAIVKGIAVLRANQSKERSSFADMAYEYWLNSLLSGLQTHAANIGGNVFNALWFNAVERTMEVASSKLLSKTGRTESRDFAELRELWRHMGKSIGIAVSNAVESWKHEYSPLNYETGYADTAATTIWSGESDNSINGKAGRIIRAFGFRPLSAADEFFRTMTAHGAAAVQAYRILKSQGRTDNLTDDIAKMVANKQSHAWDMAMQEAAYQLFRQPGGYVGQRVKAAANSAKRVPGVRWLLPFSTFMVNAAGRTSDLVPMLGPAFAAIDVAKGARTNEQVNWNRQFGNQVIGLAGFALLSSLISGDDDELPLITGSADRKRSKRSLQYATAPPLSIRLFDKYWSYSRVEPFSGALSLQVNFINAVRESGISGVPSGLMKSFSSIAYDKNYTQALRDISDAMQREGKVSDIAGNIAAGFVPNILQQTSRSLRNDILDARASTAGLTKSKIARTDVLAWMTDAIYRYDMWGRKIQRDPDSPSTSTLHYLAQQSYRLAVPVRRKNVGDILPVDIAILRWRESDGDMNGLGPPGRPTSIPDMTAKEYETYFRESGRMSYELVKDMEFSDPPTERQMSRVKKAIRIARTKAKKQIIRSRVN